MILESKTEIYEFDLSNLDAELVVDIPSPNYKIKIVFKDGVFKEVKNLFKPPYTDEEWDVLSMIYKKIQELKKSYADKKNELEADMDISKKLEREIRRKKRILEYLKNKNKDSAIFFENLIKKAEEAIQSRDHDKIFIAYKQMKDIE